MNFILEIAIDVDDANVRKIYWEKKGGTVTLTEAATFDGATIFDRRSTPPTLMGRAKAAPPPTPPAKTLWVLYVTI